MEHKAYRMILKIGYAVIFIAASLPLACGYIMEGGEILMWIARLEEMAGQLQNGQLLLYPSAELVNQHSGQYAALNTNLWLLLPAVIRMTGGSVTLAYRIYMLLLNLLAVVAAGKMFEALHDHPIVSMLGTLLFITCPYRIYLYYDKADLGKAAAWALIPLVFWGLCQFGKQKGQLKGKLKGILITALALAGIGYADGMLFFIMCGVYLLGMIWQKQIKSGAALLLGVIVFLPGAYPWLKYLLLGGMEGFRLPMNSIAAEGYAAGQFFSSWAYRAGHPGLGLGLLIGLFVTLWLYVTAEADCRKQKYGYFAVLGGIMLLLSLSAFPWDMVQRVAMPLLRIVALMGTPGIFFGWVSLMCCVLCSWGLEGMLSRREPALKLGVPCIVMFAALGNAVYICNTLTYYRMPMFL